MSKSRGKTKCVCILGITRKRAAKREIVPIVQCPVHGGSK